MGFWPWPLKVKGVQAKLCIDFESFRVWGARASGSRV